MRLTNALWNAAAVAAAVGGLLLTAPSAHAGKTTIGTSGETSLLQVLANIYNGTSLQNLDTTTSVISDAVFDWSVAKLTRVQDFNGTGNLDLHTGTGGADGTTNDRQWKDGTSDFIVEAKIAGNGQEFGYFDSSGYHSLLLNAVTGNVGAGGPVSGSVFEWVLKSAGKTWYSDNADPGSLGLSTDQDFDHMVTWQVEYRTGPKAGGRVWIVAWEDLPAVGSPSSDYDYQDLVIEIVTVPLPAAAWSGLAMLAGLGVFGWVRRRSGAGLV